MHTAPHSLPSYPSIGCAPCLIQLLPFQTLVERCLKWWPAAPSTERTCQTQQSQHSQPSGLTCSIDFTGHYHQLPNTDHSQCTHKSGLISYRFNNSLYPTYRSSLFRWLPCSFANNCRQITSQLREHNGSGTQICSNVYLV